MTRTGSPVPRRTLLYVLTAALCAGQKGKEKKQVSVVAGTVFRDPGFALAGAAIEMVEVRADGKKGKTYKTATDGRGEFAFVLPPKEARFRIKAVVKGLAPEEKETSSTPGVRTDVYFSLKPGAN